MVLPRVSRAIVVLNCNNVTRQLNEVVAYFSEHIGSVLPHALIAGLPSDPAISIHVMPPDGDRKHVTLFTSGMSDRPMTILPGGDDNFQFAELFIQLPGDWNYREIEDPNAGWPIHWLRSIASYPHENKAWLGGPATIVASDEPPQPLAPNTNFTSLLLLAEKSFVDTAEQTIQLYRMTPLYTQESELEMREDMGALIRAFDAHDVSFVCSQPSSRAYNGFVGRLHWTPESCLKNSKQDGDRSPKANAEMRNSKVFFECTIDKI